MTKKQYSCTVLLLGCYLIMAINSRAQFSLAGQLRTRTELRNGYGNLVLKNSAPAFFTSQRTRLSFGYKWDRLTFGASIQDVRVWGQDATSISLADGNRLMLHEGWTEIMLFNKADSSFKHKAIDKMILKIGRQELIYDDSRLIGNLDWLQQARRHDMILLKNIHHGWQVDLGLAFNQNSDAVGFTGTN
ncbi:MAG: alginate export family protein, partial [Chitinophagaceae bacterium]